MAKILVTGGAGYIGAHTRYFLEKRGHETVVLDNLERGHAHFVPEGMLRQVDLGDTAKVKQVLREEKVGAGAGLVCEVGAPWWLCDNGAVGVWVGGEF